MENNVNYVRKSMEFSTCNVYIRVQQTLCTYFCYLNLLFVFCYFLYFVNLRLDMFLFIHVYLHFVYREHLNNRGNRWKLAYGCTLTHLHCHDFLVMFINLHCSSQINN